jgi:hypothetical protein
MAANTIIDGEQNNLYMEFQPEYELIVEESNGRVLE